jgi:2',3'-cyclic-nucleotide 2'-phosphodiesterase (5'-nucleotidase family)
MLSASVNRRTALQQVGSAALLPALASPALAQGGPAARLIILSDLHSAYERSAQLLKAVAAEIASSPAPAAILINGDVFELGNVVATRSAGVVDWLLLRKLAALGPTVLNIGNHEPDFDNDLAAVVKKARDIGVAVVSNIVDARTGALYANAAASLELGAVPIRLAGIATSAINTYPKTTREQLEIPDPASWAIESLPSLVEGGLAVILSHAGVVADRAILPVLAPGSLLIGGHDHLIIDHAEGTTRYVHTGSWSNMFTVVDVAVNRALSTRRIHVALDDSVDEEIATLVAATMSEHLTDGERAVVGYRATPLSLGETARFAAASLAAAGGADVGFIGHTTFGTGLPRGEISRYAFDSVVRFDGKLMRAEVGQATLDAILARSNQEADIPLAARTGDFLYAAPEARGKDRYVIVANDWSAVNQKTYFGREDLVFAEIPDLRVKAVIAAALAGNPTN